MFRNTKLKHLRWSHKFILYRVWFFILFFGWGNFIKMLIPTRPHAQLSFYGLFIEVYDFNLNFSNHFFYIDFVIIINVGVRVSLRVP